jgi:hypothetical protein
MKGPKLTTKTSKPIDFIGDSRQWRRHNRKIVHPAMPRGAWTARLSGVPWKPARPIAATET